MDLSLILYASGFICQLIPHVFIKKKTDTSYVMAAHAIDWLYQEYLTIDCDTKVIGKCFLNVYRKAEIPMC